MKTYFNESIKVKLNKTFSSFKSTQRISYHFFYIYINKLFIFYTNNITFIDFKIQQSYINDFFIDLLENSLNFFNFLDLMIQIFNFINYA